MSKFLSNNMTPSPMLSSTVCMICLVRSASSVRSLTSLNSRAFCSAIAACTAKFCNSATCFSVNGRTAACDPAQRRVGAGPALAAPRGDERLGHAALGYQLEAVVVVGHQAAEGGIAKLHRLLQRGVEDRREVARRTVDRLQDFRGRGRLRERLFGRLFCGGEPALALL